ncbi:protein S100-A6-like isoform X3 [Amblyraja radiata]|uniref:protein S100-A6-like isoform X3 n=1 Tax=Amblyraja radiata TaxID=386614 RepID=UPI001402FFA0|nr:protein S100-A6-like isoform X3 [Amblyraja radiata]
MTSCTVMGTPLEKAAKEIMGIFNNYAKKGGKKDALDKAELKELFSKEMKMFSATTFDQLATAMLQNDTSGDVDFQEFLKMLFALINCKEKECQQSK